MSITRESIKKVYNYLSPFVSRFVWYGIVIISMTLWVENFPYNCFYVDSLNYVFEILYESILWVMFIAEPCIILFDSLNKLIETLRDERNNK